MEMAIIHVTCRQSEINNDDGIYRYLTVIFRNLVPIYWSQFPSLENLFLPKNDF